LNIAQHLRSLDRQHHRLPLLADPAHPADFLYDSGEHNPSLLSSRGYPVIQQSSPNRSTGTRSSVMASAILAMPSMANAVGASRPPTILGAINMANLSTSPAASIAPFSLLPPSSRTEPISR